MDDVVCACNEFKCDSLKDELKHEHISLKHQHLKHKYYTTSMLNYNQLDFKLVID